MKHIYLCPLFFSLLLLGCDTETPLEQEISEFNVVYPAAGNQIANRVLVQEDGVFIVGTSENGAQSSIVLMRTDINGNAIWSRTLASDVNCEGFGIIRLSDDNLLVIGSEETGDNKNILLMKTDGEGNVLWQKSFGGSESDIGRDVIELQGGGFMLIGTTSSFGAGIADMYVVRTDAAGNQLWARTFGGGSLDGGSELVQADAFSVMLLGFTESFGVGNRDQYLQSVSIEGDSLWSSTYGGQDYEESQGMRRTDDGGYVLCAHSASVDPVHAMLGMKIGPDGSVQWEHHFGAFTTHDGGEGVLEDSDGNYLFLGRSDSFGQGEQVYVVKTDATGSIVFESQFGAEGNQRGNDIAESTTSYFIVGTSDVANDSDILLIKQPK
jgi:hypothetical protein